ncbi:hypothetical protein TWF481_010993 [Arthrobotrys musiformis]|uniref:Uncharacterized protein n=1 Tax=Arthrobotrys musiformis TaxID=47236 RepID=A0AAV9VY35_9PEZI
MGFNSSTSGDDIMIEARTRQRLHSKVTTPRFAHDSHQVSGSFELGGGVHALNTGLAHMTVAEPGAQGCPPSDWQPYSGNASPQQLIGPWNTQYLFTSDGHFDFSSDGLMHEVPDISMDHSCDNGPDLLAAHSSLRGIDYDHQAPTTRHSSIITSYRDNLDTGVKKGPPPTMNEHWPRSQYGSTNFADGALAEWRQKAHQSRGFPTDPGTYELNIEAPYIGEACSQYL